MVNYREIARAARCSAATVSRALNTPAKVTPELVRRVTEARALLRRDPDRAHAASAGSGRLVGVLIPSATNPVFAVILSTLQKRLRVGGYGVLIAQSNYDPDEEEKALATFLAERPAGLILTLCDATRMPPLRRALPPAVLLHQGPNAAVGASVSVDNVAAARRLTEIVLVAGHRRIIFLSGTFAASDRARARYRGFCDALAAADLPILPPVEICFVRDYADIDLTEVMDWHRPTAIVASNDLIALGAMGGLRRLGFAIPDDVSVVGFDGIELGRLMMPTLATMELPNQVLGACAASLLLDMIERGVSPYGLTLDTGFRAGGSLGPPPGDEGGGKR